MTREEKIQESKRLHNEFLHLRANGQTQESLKVERDYLVLRKELIEEVTTEVKEKKSVHISSIAERVKNRVKKPKRETGIRSLDRELVTDKDYYLGKSGGLTLGNFIQIAGTRGAGKALRNSEKVLTPKGWVRNGDIRTGDYVIGSDGRKKEVLGVYPQGKRDIYRVGFIDDTYVDCDIDHIWTVFNGNNKKVNMTVRDILESKFSTERYDKRYGTFTTEYHFSIPVSSPCEFGDDGNLPLHPYLLGALLGDGGFTDGNINLTKDIKFLNKALEFLPSGDTYTIKKSDRSPTARIKTEEINSDMSSTKKALIKLGLYGKYSHEKFIPDIYKNSSLESRRLIIQGLIDTDGYIKNGKLEEYSTSSKALADDFLEVGRSIGMFLTIKSRIPKYTYKGKKLDGKRNYRIYQKSQNKKTIKSIKKLDMKDECTCIKINSSDSLYVTSGYNLTHNTTILIKMMSEISNYETVSWFNFEMSDEKVIETLGQFTYKDIEYYEGSREILDIEDEIKFLYATGVRHFVIDSMMKIQVKGMDRGYASFSFVSSKLSELTSTLGVNIYLIQQMSSDSQKNGTLMMKHGNDAEYDADYLFYVTRSTTGKKDKAGQDIIDNTKRYLVCTKNRVDHRTFTVEIKKSEIFGIEPEVIEYES